MFVFGGYEQSIGMQPYPLLLNGERIQTSEKIEKDANYDYEKPFIEGVRVNFIR